MDKYIAYYRVSSQLQGQSGLGLRAQQECVTGSIAQRNGTLIAEYTETESGRKNKRPELQEAIRHAKAESATLVIAKLDRLARNAYFTNLLMEEKVKFYACDMPDANDLTIRIMAAVNQDEAERISQRTKAALDQKRRRDPDWKPGTPANLTTEARKKAWTASHLKAANNENNKRAKGYIMALRQTGLSYGQIADKLNAEGFQTSQKKHFSAMTVKRLHDRK